MADQAWMASVTFEYDHADPWYSREEIVDSSPDGAARRAVFRALSKRPRVNYHSVVIVLDRKG